MRPRPRRILLTLLAAGAILGAAVAGPKAGQAQDNAAVGRIVEERLYGGSLAQAEAAFAAHLARSPDDASARLGLGFVRFGRAVEKLGQALHRHGLEPVVAGGIPLFRLPVPPNPNPEPLSYAKVRAILADFAGDLDVAGRTLAEIGDRPAKLPLQIGRIGLDLDGDGRMGADERLWRVIERTSPGLFRDRASAEAFAIGFDNADAYWLRGYANLLAALAEFWLAHDFHETVDTSFHLLFPRAGLPMSREPTAGSDLLGIEGGQIADAVAFLHTIRWPVAEPERMRSVRMRLKAVTDLSRKNWAAILSETDDDREWIPSPRQTSVTGIPVTDEQVKAWHATLDAVDAVLDGRKLVPHWRFRRGIDARRLFEEPQGFDLVLWATGQGLVPYLAQGEIVDEATFAPALRAFGGDFLFYAFWFN